MASGICMGFLGDHKNMRPTFAALNIVSNFSFLKSGSHPEELVHEAARLNYSAVAVTDDCSVSGLVRAHVTAKECNIKLLIGAGFDVAFSTPQLPTFSRYIVLAQNREGYGNLCEIITASRKRAEKGQYQLQINDLIQFASHCILIAIVDAKNAHLMPSRHPMSPQGGYLRVVGHPQATLPRYATPKPPPPGVSSTKTSSVFISHSSE